MEIPILHLKEIYPQLVDIIGVSSPERTGIEELKEKIANETLNIELIGQRWPKAWVAVEKALDDLQENHSYIDSAKFKSICKENGVIHEGTQAVLGVQL